LQNSIFNSAILYVMSGTGNTYRLACWMRQVRVTPGRLYYIFLHPFLYCHICCTGWA
jgi:hypothetical protein